MTHNPNQDKTSWLEKQGRLILPIWLLFFIAVPLLVTMTLLPTVSATNASRESEQFLLPVRRIGALVYFAQYGSDRIHVYDLSHETWQPPVELSGSITAFDVNDEAIYAALETTMIRVDQDGTQEHVLFEADKVVIQVLEFDSFLVLASSDTARSYYTTINSQTGAVIDTDTHHYSSAVPLNKNKELLHFYVSIGRDNISFKALNSSGYMLGWHQNPDTDSFSIEYGRFVSPDQGVILDQLGNVFNTTDLTRNGQLEPSPNQASDIIFHGELPITIEDRTITSFSKDLKQTGQYVVAHEPDKVELFGNNLYLFTFENTTPTVQTLPLSIITPDDPNTPLDATKLDIEPDFIEYGDDIVYIYSKKHRSLFRWSVSQESYLTPFHVRYAAKYMALSTDAELLFIQRTGRYGYIDKMSLLDGSSDHEFIAIDHRATGIASANDFLVVCTNGVSSYDFAGQLIDVFDPSFNCYFNGYDMSADQQRIVGLQTGYSIKRIDIDDEGIIIEGFEHRSDSWQLPVRMLNNDERVITSSGTIHDVSTFATLNTLPHQIDDAAWYRDHLFTITSNHLPETTIKKWDSDLSVVRQNTTLGDPVYIAPIDQYLLIVSRWLGQLRFSVWDDTLNLISGTTSGFMLLPAVFDNACNNIIKDDFSDPASGWPSGSTPYYSFGYGNNAYHITHINHGYWTAVTRGDTWEGGDEIKVEGHVISGRAIWGILFGLNDNWTEFYTFEISPSDGRYYIMHYRAESGWTIVSDKFNPHIEQNGVNTLRIWRHSYDDERVAFEISGHYITSMGSIAAGRVGLTSGAFNPNTTIKYDNYRFAARYCLLNSSQDNYSSSSMLELPIPDFYFEQNTRVRK